jgi:hypothetical protein
MSVKIFLSTVSDEFRTYRDALRTDLTRHNVEVKVQEDFKDLGGDTLDKLDVYIAHCDAVVCTENVVRFDLLIESLNVRGDGRANILPLEPGWLDLQVQEST